MREMSDKTRKFWEDMNRFLELAKKAGWNDHMMFGFLLAVAKNPHPDGFVLSLGDPNKPMNSVAYQIPVLDTFREEWNKVGTYLEEWWGDDHWCDMGWDDFERVARGEEPRNKGLGVELLPLH